MANLDRNAVEEMLARAEKATNGPWNVWDGPEYCGGGKDLCIGAGEDWVANMDHRWGKDYQKRVEHDQSDCHNEKYDCAICQLNGDITSEQGRTAEFIAHAREDVPALCTALLEAWADVERLREVLDHLVKTVDSPCSDFNLLCDAVQAGKVALATRTEDGKP